MELRHGLTVSIVTYNTWDRTAECIHSLLAQRGQQEFEILIYDNGRGSYSGPDLPSNVRITKGETNVGFGAGHNKNLEVAAFDTFVVLNPDVTVELTTLASLREVIQEDAAIVAAAPILIYPDGSEQLSFRKFPNVRTEIARVVGADRQPGGSWSTLVPMKPGRGLVDVEQPAGAVLAVDTATLTELKGFDTDFPMYFEDVDLCTRLCRLGRVVAVRSLLAKHDGEGTAKKYRTATTFWIENSRQRYHRKFSVGVQGKITLAAAYASCVTHMLGTAAAGLLRRDGSRQALLSKSQGYAFALIAAVAGSESYWKSRFLGK
ncbi:glycosyltransferase family 2 protein [Paenarthrobacter sp. TYUT067]|uniref:glycosyltransferase n=1 Tax=Paenarthrobacter sp. TYUT067 TaxID=2926245 RepID=UPI00202F860C|nr:glycosyltransferase family 2 protein [Paenarthrobacter sp. TYUT067]MCM0615261.1 glycosyltransferase family 2 protein [Paenarthrobacter sp. TYUT067]